MQRIGLIAVLAVVAYLVVLVLMPPQEEAAQSPLARPAAPEQPMKDKMSKAQAMSTEAETRKLLAELRTIPVSEYAVNLSKYQRLLELHPDDETFMRKVAFYSQRLSQKRSSSSY